MVIAQYYQMCVILLPWSKRWPNKARANHTQSSWGIASERKVGHDQIGKDGNPSNATDPWREENVACIKNLWIHNSWKNEILMTGNKHFSPAITNMTPEVRVMVAFTRSSMLPILRHLRAKMAMRTPIAPRTMPTIMSALTPWNKPEDQSGHKDGKQS